MIKLCRTRYNLDVQEISLTNDQNRWCQAQLADLLNENRQVIPLKVEASHRRFYRVQDQFNSYILMVSPPELEQNEQFVAMQSIFSQYGIPVPTLIAVDFKLGLFVMSDLGTQDFEFIYATDERDLAISTAIDCLHKIQTIREAPPYTEERFQLELEIFQEWFAQKTLGQMALSILDVYKP